MLDIFIQDDSKVCVAASEEGKLVIYNMHTKEFFRTLFHPDALPIHRVLFSLQPFGSVIMYSEVDGKMYSYSVNGQLLASKKFKFSRITDLQLSSDSNNMDFLVGEAEQAFSTTTGEIGVANVPFLENVKAYTVVRRTAITCLLVLRRGEGIIAGDILGNMHIVFNDSNISNKEARGAVIPQSVLEAQQQPTN